MLEGSVTGGGDAEVEQTVMTANSHKVLLWALVAFLILAMTVMTISKFSSTETASSAGVSSPSVGSSVIAASGPPELLTQPDHCLPQPSQ
jgi:hypothetical protein